MKHDETNFDANAGHRAPLDAEVEARVVAWVAGEMSADEAAALERLAATNPAVREFQREMAAVQGLVVEGMRAETEPLRLADSRREQLLATLSAPRTGAAPVPLRERTAKLPKHPLWWSWRGPQIYFMSSGLAAACLVGLLLFRMQMPELYEARANGQSVVDRAEGNAVPTWRDTVFDAEKRAVAPKSRARGLDDRAAELTVAVNLPAAAAMDSDTSNRGTRATGDLSQARLGAPELQGLAITNKSLVAKERESVSYAPMAMPSAPPASVALGLARSTPPPTLIESKRVGADGPVKLDAFVVNEERAGFAAAASSSMTSGANPGATFGFNDVSTAAAKDLSAPLVTTGTITLNSGASMSSTVVDGTLVLSGAGPAPAASTNPANSMVSFDVVAPAAPLPPAEGLVGKKAEAQFAGNAGVAGTGFSPVPARSENDVVRLDAFTVSAPPKTKGLAALGRAFSSLLAPAPTGETATAQESVSTFSLHVSDVSFRLATAAVAAMVRGENVTEPKIRAEEFYNAFDYGDPAPTTAEKITARIEQSAHPFLQQRNLVRIGLKVAATGRAAGQPLRLTVLLDTSGSMEREDRAAAVLRALEVLVSLLGSNDRLTVIGFARQPRLLAENLAGDQAREALAVIARTPAEGGTNLEAALKLGGELARRHLTAGAQNRIVVLTDGAANLGDAEPARLMAAVETLRQQGIAFDACGVGLEGTGDTLLEALTRKGNGRYYALDSAETADASFARQLAGAFRPAAENVKLQVRFNPARVGRYRLIGFEEHRLKTEDFRNDQVDAAELAAEEGAVALYQVEVLPQGAGELGEVFVRFRDAASGEMVERSWSMPYEARVPSFARATPSLRLAGIAALLAEKFLETPAADQFKLGDLAEPVNALRREYAAQPRVQELVTMFNQVRQLTRE